MSVALLSAADDQQIGEWTRVRLQRTQATDRNRLNCSVTRDQNFHGFKRCETRRSVCRQRNARSAGEVVLSFRFFQDARHDGGGKTELRRGSNGMLMTARQHITVYVARAVMARTPVTKQCHPRRTRQSNPGRSNERKGCGTLIDDVFSLVGSQRTGQSFERANAESCRVKGGWSWIQIHANC